MGAGKPLRNARIEATIYDVAEAAGFAISTVSLALRGDPRVRPATREKVLAAARNLNFSANVSASALAKGSIPFVAICCHLYPDSLAWNSYAGMEMLMGINQRLQGTKYAIYLVGWKSDRSANLEHLADMASRRFICGSIWLSYSLDRRDMEFLKKSDLPVVLTELAVPGVPSVGVDQRAGGRLAAGRLIKAGCRRVACVTGPKQRLGELSPISGRLEGFRARLMERKIRVGSRQVFFSPSFSFKDGYEAALKILKTLPGVDAVFCAAGDKAALGLMEGLKASGKRVPDDVKVVGYDGIQETYYSAPPLATVVQPFFEVGFTAADSLVRAVEGRQGKAAKVLLQPKFREGKSV